MGDNRVDIQDLRYELRMLLGAVKISCLFESSNLGNLVNYVKDSAYVHIRNVYNFFEAKSRNDAKATQFTKHSFDVALYHEWSDALHQHVLHIKTKRTHPNNINKSRIHINQMIPIFAYDIQKLWKELIGQVKDLCVKTQLEDAFLTAEKEAQEDYENAIKQLKLSI